MTIIKVDTNKIYIKEALERKDKIKMLIIPKKSDINKGDKVGFFKLNTKDNLENI